MRKDSCIMGMSASQARLLSITSRLTNNEFRAQTITNSKLRLATESQEASQKYMDALSSKKLVFGQYDANGDKTYTPLTANVLLSYGDLKNQYALVNTSGQILLPGSDIKTYMEANGDYLKYMKLNGVNTVEVENDEYTDQLQSILGADWAEYIYDTDFSSPQAVQDTLSGLTDKGLLKTINDLAGIELTQTTTDEETEYTAKIDETTEGSISYLFKNGKTSEEGEIIIKGIESVNNAADYKALTDELSYASGKLLNSISSLRDASGVMGKYIQTISNPPAWNIGNKPTWTEPTKPSSPDFESLVDNYNDSQCYDSVEESVAGIGHMEHNLAALIWGTNGLSGGNNKITNSTGTITITSNSTTDSSVSLTNYTTFGSTDSSAALGKALNNLTSYKCVQEMNQSIIDLYCDVVNYLSSGSSSTQLNSDRYSITSTADKCSDSDLYSRWEDMYTDLSSLQNELNDEIQTTYNTYRTQLYNQFTSEETAWNNKLDNFKNTVVPNWLKSFKDLAIKVQKAIDALGEPTKKVPDTTDAKYQWYTNLWYRMGGGAKIGTTEKLDKSNFVELDENLINNAEWLEFAFEHGILTLEQAIFFEDGSEKYSKEMGQYDWVSKAYTNAVDIVSQDDEVAIAIAETKYKNTITEIENKDKKYDQDLKKLDTEHNALQTEYESVKEVISKNVERSFKAFS